MATTYELIASQTLGSDTATVTFSSIPGTYDDLLLVSSARSTRSANVNDLLLLTFNTGGSYTDRFVRGTGSSIANGSGTLGRCGSMSASSATASTYGSGEVYIPNYSGSTAKSYSYFGASESNATGANMEMGAVLWDQTSAITQIQLTASNGDLVSGSSFYLYGITKA